MNEETPLQNRIRKAVSMASRGSAFALRNNTGLFLTFAGQKVRAGLGKGTSDLIGLASRVIRQEDVGRKVAVFVALEVKTDSGSPTKEQENFLHVVNRAGGLGAIVRDPAEIDSLLADLPGELPKREQQ